MRWEFLPLGPSPPLRASGRTLTLFSPKGRPGELYPLLDPAPQGLLGGVSTPQSATSTPPCLRVYMLYCAKAIILIPTLLHLPSLCFANVLSHIILHTHSNHWALGTVQEVIVAFVQVAPPLLFLLKGAAPPCQLSSYNCLQTQGPNDRIYSTWKHNYSPWFNCYCVNGL